MAKARNIPEFRVNDCVRGRRNGYLYRITALSGDTPTFGVADTTIATVIEVDARTRQPITGARTRKISVVQLEFA